MMDDEVAVTGLIPTCKRMLLIISFYLVGLAPADGKNWIESGFMRKCRDRCGYEKRGQRLAIRN
ncbi:hypothetical protein OSCI_3820013 [Kamptonema sp. PCC 6506]|nr:hypothetical protein OSCI_3820013 [Kamptonema sp. PCC 6506]